MTQIISFCYAKSDYYIFKYLEISRQIFLNKILFIVSILIVKYC